MSDLLSLDLFAGRLEDANPLAIDELDAHAIGLAGRGIEDRHVGLMDGHGLVDDATGGALHGVGLDVLLDDIDAFDDHMVFVSARGHGAALALVAAGQHDDLVAGTDLVHGLPQTVGAQSTSGASDTIFMKRSVRSSRVTGPKMRVPMGSSLALSSTAALPSNLTSEPSWRRTPLAVRTTTAL
mmetsp:Transcript_1639/g.3207  ORF Transcript_1639/g.3207 Transcript_1639/m.3207 type:complete len:183 (-) Transcript_1639:9-557(-)